jgi:hypothetical protein
MTNLGRHMEEADLVALQEKSPSGDKLVFKSVEQGAATTVWAASSPHLSGRGGIYLEDAQIAPAAVEGKNIGVEPYAVNPATAEKLWALSEELVGQSFDY